MNNSLDNLNKYITEMDNKMLSKDTLEKGSVNQIQTLCHNNVVNSKALKKVQKETLSKLKSYLSMTYGPMGSYTAIISGTNNETIKAEYSKDGLKVLKHVLFDQPIELSIQSEVRDICQYVDRQVGDGTTSAVILSSLIYEGLLDIMTIDKIPQRTIVREFNNIVKECQNIIQSKAKPISYDAIKNICMISTNGNEEVSNDIVGLYNEFGFDVDIDVSISNDQNTKIKAYDGLTINEGYSDPGYINTPDGTVEIHNPRIYAFTDPIDTPQMISYMEKIIMSNIFEPAQNDPSTMIPTVIVSPIISRDSSALLTKLIELLYSYDKENMKNQKPPILIITNLAGVDEDIAKDIMQLCNCKYIQKYINPEIEEKAQKDGDAPTIDTITEFYGTAELVVADGEKTKFINPDSMKDGNKDSYNTLLSFLEAELKKRVAENEDKTTIYRLKKRIRCLKANLVEFLVGGIGISDRDSLRDLVEDATKNCRSASEYGYGRAANFEGLEAISYMYDHEENDGLRKEIIAVVYKSYIEAAKILYNSVLPEELVDKAIELSMDRSKPFNVATLYENNGDIENEDSMSPDVISSIRTDIEILDGISKIITMMATSNQALLEVPSLNRY